MNLKEINNFISHPSNWLTKFIKWLSSNITIKSILHLQIGAEPNIVLFFDCPEEEMVKRVLNRNQVLLCYCVINFLWSSWTIYNLKYDAWLQGRVDDNIDTIKKRLKVFEALNRPVINYYSEKGKLYKVCTCSATHLWKLFHNYLMCLQKNSVVPKQISSVWSLLMLLFTIWGILLFSPSLIMSNSSQIHADQCSRNRRWNI